MQTSNIPFLKDVPMTRVINGVTYNLDQGYINAVLKNPELKGTIQPVYINSNTQIAPPKPQ